ncbi:calcium and calcium/calmodulin-dependent serine/threonine-protein kinase [Echria macrotheca]|uniref:Calcium and calcium/calmodulin-dependent serine/threonine-protein kinase n=1 Tax=Echria macrotheca TaxID=438768 RepID=A0AAJ0F9C3_9PEZI|nr:calcium and calcium/calmodulin-dependent serine/threonine-protein kinase [Echria macrotheca]
MDPRKRKTSAAGPGSRSPKSARRDSRTTRFNPATPQLLHRTTSNHALTVPSIELSPSPDEQKLRDDDIYKEIEQIESQLGGEEDISPRTRDRREHSPNPSTGIPPSQQFREAAHYNYNEKSDKALSEWSYCSQGGVEFEGQHIADVADKQKAKIYDLHASPERFLDEVRKDLEPALSSMFTKSELYFLPWTDLHNVLSTDTVPRLLQILNSRRPGSQYSNEELKEFANKIAPPLPRLAEDRGVNGQFRRTFATLILSKRESMIFAFVEAGFDDEQLLLVPFGPGLCAAPGKFQHLFMNWDKREIKHFKKYRWEVSPTFFAVKRELAPAPKAGSQGADGNVIFKRVRYLLRSTEEVLPFEGSEREDIKGGFAEVRFFKLHKDQQDLPRFTRRGQDNDIAVKTFKNDKKNSAEQREAYANEVFMMARLASIDSPHMAKLLAMVEVPRGVSHRQRSDYHLVLEAADGTVEDLWKSKDWEKYTKRKHGALALSKWVALQCYGLADALWKFHRFPKPDGDTSDKTYGLHCDIKPDNILHYKDWKVDAAANPQGTVDPVFGVLQLSDFGLSSFHSIDSVENHRVVGAFLDYTAPETEFLLTQSPAADIWHLGCLFLDFATWLVEGPKKYEDFCKKRKTTGLRVTASRFATFCPVSSNSPNESGTTHVKVNEAVLKQATKLCQHRNSSKFVRELCHIAVNYMLVMRDPNQTQKKDVEYSWEPQAVADRLTSEQVAEILKDLTERDDTFFRRFADGVLEWNADDVLPFEHPAWKRHYLKLNCTVEQARQISQRVYSGKSGSGLEPGLAVVEQPPSV